MNRFSLLRFPRLPKMAMFMIAVLCVGSIFASAQAAPTAGYDLLKTVSGTSINLAALGLGVVPLQGVPIVSSLGTTDTIMDRPGNTTFGQPQTLLVAALFLKSTSPVEYEGQSADVYVTVNNTGGAISTSVLPQPDSLQASTGTITIDSGQSTGGTFTATFIVFADVILVHAGTSVTNPANYIAHQPSPATNLASGTSTWVTTPPPGYPLAGRFPSGGFYPTVVAHTVGPHPVTYATCGEPPASGCVSSPPG